MQTVRRNVLFCCTIFLASLFPLLHVHAVSQTASLLRKGDTDPSIKELQIFLNTHGYVIASRGAGSPGHETSYFGSLTFAALKRFQKSNGIPSTGNFGPLTQKELSSIRTKEASGLHVQSTPAHNSPPANSSRLMPIISPGFGGGGGGTPAATDATAPSTPAYLSAAAGGLTEIDLMWSASTDNTAVTSYIVYRDGARVGTSATYSYADTGLSASSTHTYYVVAQDAAGNVSGTSNSATATSGNWSDGFDGAVSGPPQRIGYLQNYTARAPWHVAGVDYRIGATENATYADPATIAIAGVTIDTPGHIIEIASDNVVLDGYDFSLNGGWQVHITGASPTITHSKFVVGANTQPPLVIEGTGGATIRYNTIDGANTQVAYGGLLNMFGSGTYTIEYNWFKNAYEDFINAGGTSQAQIVRYNLFQNGGQGNDAGGHPDWMQFYGSGNVFSAVDVGFNTFIQDATHEATQGINLAANQGPPYTRYDSVNFTGNTVSLPITATLVTNVNYPFIIDTSELNGTAHIDYNYVDRTGVYYAWVTDGSVHLGPYQGSVYLSNNIDMLTGSGLPLQNAVIPPEVTLTSPSDGAVLSGTSVSLAATASTSVSITHVRFAVDNALIGSPDTSAPYGITWDTTSVANGSHTLSAVAKDSNGYLATSSITITTSNIGPSLSAISAGTPGATNATITWTTGTSANSKVVYGLTSAYGSSSSTAAMSTSHSIMLSGLSSATTYHYAVVSRDGLGDYSTSTDHTFITSSGSAYIGPGNIASNASAWWGLRAYSGAVATTPAIQVTCASVNYVIPTTFSGDLATSTIASDCGGNTIYLRTLYDQTGNGWDLVQTDPSHQATITLDCIGSLPCISSTGAGTYAVSSLEVAAPYTFTFGGKADPYSAQSNILSDTTSQSILYQTAANTITSYDGSTVAHAATDNQWHAIQSVFGNYTNDVYALDTASTTFTGGSNSPSLGGGSVAFLSYTSNGYGFRGASVEGGLWQGAFSGATLSNMQSNMATYWGW